MSENELHQIQQRTNEVTDASLESTRNMLRMAEDSKAIGAKTLETLNEQGEQLDRIEGGMDQINSDLREAEGTLRKMDKWCGLCVCPCTKNRGFKEDPKTWKNKGDGKTVTQAPKSRGGGGDFRDGGGDAGTSQGGYIQRITNDAREDEMDENLHQVSNILGDMRHMALDMQVELEGQNQQLDRLNLKAESNDLRIKNATDHSQAFLK